MWEYEDKAARSGLMAEPEAEGSVRIHVWFFQDGQDVTLPKEHARELGEWLIKQSDK